VKIPGIPFHPVPAKSGCPRYAPHLAREVDTALQFTKTILRVRAPEPRKPGKPIELDVSTTYTYRPSPEPEGKIEPFSSEVFRSKVIPRLALAAGDRLIADLAENLNAAVAIHCRNHVDDADDYSTIWRQFIDDGSHYRTLDETVSAMTDAIKVLLEHEPGSQAMIVESLAQYKWAIFARLSAFTLKIASQVEKRVLASFVSDHRVSPAHQRIPNSGSCWRRRQ
jgi:hypothetical protein